VGSVVVFVVRLLFQQSDIWQRINRFAQAWNQYDSPLYNGADNIWFEFDMDDIDLEQPFPSFFYGPHNINSREDLHQINRTALEALLQDQLDPAVHRQLSRCVDQLPEHAALFQIGTMLSRNTSALRLCINEIGISDISTILSDLNWGGPIHTLEQLLVHLDSLVDQITLDIDLGTAIHPKVGLECYITADEDKVEKWLRLLQLLEDADLCVPEKREALLEYPGGIHRFTTKKEWPAHWLEISKIEKNKNLSIYLRDLHHIKISYTPNQPLQAKAYLSVGHAWLPTKEIIEARQKAQASTMAP
ncbi:MAG: hypothetical protein AAF985_26670, partial [Bacteroidota bacterium]